MKILHIPTGSLCLDGIYSCINSYMTNMNTSDIKIDILAVNYPDKDVVKSVKKAGFGLKIIPNRKKNVISYFFKLIRLMCKQKYDIVHVHGSSAIMSVELLAAKISGCKVRIAHSHNTSCRNLRADRILRPLFMKLYTHAFACGKDAGKWLFNNKPFIVLPNGRDLNKFEFSRTSRHKIRRQLNVNDDTVLIGHVGRFNDQKNHKYLVKIFREYKKLNKNSKLILIGTGRLFEEVRNQIEKYGLGKDVILTGTIDNVHEFLSAMDIMVFPSLYEGLPLVVIEWQIAGLPCVISDTITDECIVEDNVKKMSISENPKKWAEFINNIRISDREGNKDSIKRNMRKAGYDIAEDAKKLKSYYYSFLENI